MNITDRLEVQIVGQAFIYQAEVVRLRPSDGAPYLQVLNETGWPILKPGDYIIMTHRDSGPEVPPMFIEWEEL